MEKTLSATSSRVDSIDILRGIVIVLMALDHVRHFFSITAFDPEDLSLTSPAWFFTRWITHFCAPTFVFLAGASAFLFGQRAGKRKLSRFLFTRGLWLIFIELIIMNLIWKFDLGHWYFVQVIWVIGVSMLALSVFIFLPRWVLVIVSVGMIAGHNLLDNLHYDTLAWHLLHKQTWAFPVSDSVSLAVIYPIIPWPGVMLGGYLLGFVFQQSNRWDRKLFLLTTGGVLLLLFGVLRTLNLYGDPNAWTIQQDSLYTFMDFIRVNKYPPSLLFILLTLGHALLALSVLDGKQNRITNIFKTFGSVPFFFYIVHFFVLHVAAIVFHGLRYGEWRIWLFDDPASWPSTYVPSLTLTFIVWGFLTVSLYFLCRWFARYKKQHTYWWLKYL